MDAHVSAGIVCVCVYMCVQTCLTNVVWTTVYTVALWGRKSLMGTRCKSTSCKSLHLRVQQVVAIVTVVVSLQEINVSLHDVCVCVCVCVSL